MWSVSKINDIVEIKLPFSRNTEWEQWVLLTTDRHWDNPKSNHDLQKKHLEEAKELNAPVIDGGDFFCAMQGKYDKRSNKASVRPEHQNERYFDSLIETADDFFKPYKDLFACLIPGNHELTVLKNQETDLTQRLADKFNCPRMGITGFIRFRFESDGDNSIQNKLLHFHHGYGGGGPVTRDVIQTNRKAVFLNDTDIVWSGHTHDSFIVPIQQLRVSRFGVLQRTVQWHVKTATYKDDYCNGVGNWSNSKGLPPKLLGAAWLRFFYKPKENRVLIEPILDIEQ